jgi:hypothetical protein
MYNFELQERNRTQGVSVVKTKTLISNSFSVLKLDRMDDDSYSVSLTRNSALGFFKNHEVLTISKGMLDISDDDTQGVSMIKKYIAGRLAYKNNHTANAALSFRKLQVANDFLMHYNSDVGDAEVHMAGLRALEQRAMQLQSRLVGFHFYPGGELGEGIVKLLSTESDDYWSGYQDDCRIAAVSATYVF